MASTQIFTEGILLDFVLLVFIIALFIYTIVSLKKMRKKVINSEYYHRHYNGYYCLQAHIYWLDFLVYYYAHGIENNASRYS